MTLEMKADIHALWVDALESGEYTQGRGALHIRAPKNALGHETGPERFCCLGVLCHLAFLAKVIEVAEEEGGTTIGYITKDAGDGERGVERNYLPPEVVAWAGLRYPGESPVPGHSESRGVFDRNSNSLASLNDEGVEFPAIAKTIRERIRAV